VANDVEDRKLAEQLQADLTHASRVSTMGELVASISHELAQPLTVTTANAKASLRWLQRDPPEVTEARKGTEKIIEAGTLASEIINRLRSLYKKAPPKRELVAINEVIGEMAGMLGGQARGHGVSIRTDLKDDLPMTVADRVQLQQVLMNLMLNGIEAMKDTGGVLTVKSQLGEDSQIEISVNDTGPGLPLGKADQIFDAFFTTKPQGSGMGLAISKSIVESHGGRIWANGNGGRGATFHFTLPAAPAKTNPPVDAA
jgi:signal transduction histidine kinase